MRQRIQDVRGNARGLIELQVVVVILGVLTCVVVFAVAAFDDDVIAAACESDRRNVAMAGEAFYAQRGVHATAIDDSTPTTPASATTLVGASFLREAPSSAKYTITYSPATGMVTSVDC